MNETQFPLSSALVSFSVTNSKYNIKQACTVLFYLLMLNQLIHILIYSYTSSLVSDSVGRTKVPTKDGNINDDPSLSADMFRSLVGGVANLAGDVVEGGINIASEVTIRVTLCSQVYKCISLITVVKSLHHAWMRTATGYKCARILKRVIPQSTKAP